MVTLARTRPPCRYSHPFDPSVVAAAVTGWPTSRVTSSTPASEQAWPSNAAGTDEWALDVGGTGRAAAALLTGGAGRETLCGAPPVSGVEVLVAAVLPERTTGSWAPLGGEARAGE